MISVGRAPAKVITGERAALVSFYLTPGETIVFWSDGSSKITQVVSIPIGRGEITAAVQKFRLMFSAERINPLKPHYSINLAWLETLMHRLLDPLAEGVERNRTLVIAPHAELHHLPLQLFAVKNGEPLGVTHAITYTANLSLYALLISRGSLGSAAPLPSLCLSIPSVDDNESVRSSFAIAPKAFAQRTDGLFLQDTKASWQAFRRYAGSAGNLYLSCHGLFDEKDWLNSVLFLSDGKSLPLKTRPNSSTHRLSVRDILEMRIRARLVVLDACMSGIQRFFPGDEPVGFPTAFLLSGARAVIATNWVVEQGSARFFMTALLESWSSEDCSLGEAMQKACAATRAEYPHPYYWAGFSLYGNNRLRFQE